MCFIISITASDQDMESSQEIATSFISESGLRLVTNKKNSSYILSDPEGGCSCGILSDDADWSDQIWKLKTEYLQDFANSINHIFSSRVTALKLSALWQGDLIKEEYHIHQNDLIAAIQSNQVRNFTEYTVSR